MKQMFSREKKRRIYYSSPLQDTSLMQFEIVPTQVLFRGAFPRGCPAGNVSLLPDTGMAIIQTPPSAVALSLLPAHFLLGVQGSIQNQIFSLQFSTEQAGNQDS